MLHRYSFLSRRIMPTIPRLFPRCCLRCFSPSNNNGNKIRNHQNKNGFGIVAAMTSNQVIGVNGSLPWKNLTQDKKHFINLTRNKVLIVGRRTFALEDPSLKHIRHCRACIVVSGTMNQEDLVTARDGSDSEYVLPELLLARSFEEALELANAEKHKMITQQSDNDRDNDETVDCWVAGGEAIYKEALHHANAMEIRLTHVKIMVDINEFRDVTYFPLEDMKEEGWVCLRRDLDDLCEFQVWYRHFVEHNKKTQQSNE